MLLATLKIVGLIYHYQLRFLKNTHNDTLRTHATCQVQNAQKSWQAIIANINKIDR